MYHKNDHADKKDILSKYNYNYNFTIYNYNAIHQTKCIDTGATF